MLKNIKTPQRLIVVSAVSMVLLSACATSSKPQQGGIIMDEYGMKVDPFYRVPDMQKESIPSEAEPNTQDSVITSRSVERAPQISSAPTSQTVIALMSQAKDQEQRGYPERAAAVVERALRIEPKNAQLWHVLALLRLQQGRHALAESLAAKSNALAHDDESLRNENQTIIEQARLLQGKVPH